LMGLCPVAHREAFEATVIGNASCQSSFTSQSLRF
jgi:hypothetical protein